MVRGVGGQEIFHDSKDRQKYISIMTKYKDICQYELYGYCLMPNHVHLLIKECVQTVSQMMQRMRTSYVYWYNQKYERAGHLFQGRSRSEVVGDDRYLLVVLRFKDLKEKDASIRQLARITGLGRRIIEKI